MNRLSAYYDDLTHKLTAYSIHSIQFCKLWLKYIPLQLHVYYEIVLCLF